MVIRGGRDWVNYTSFYNATKLALLHGVLAEALHDLAPQGAVAATHEYFHQEWKAISSTLYSTTVCVPLVALKDSIRTSLTRTVSIFTVC